MVDINAEQNNAKAKKSLRINKKVLLFVAICILIIAVFCAVAYYFSSKDTDKSTNKAQSSIQLRGEQIQPPSVQPIGSPNAGQPYGDTLKNQIETAKIEAQSLAAEIAKIPTPQTREEKVALSKKRLELGKLYYKAMMYKETIETLDMVEYIFVMDYSEARVYMAKTAIALDSKSLAIRFYQQAIDALKSYPAEYQDTEKINEYTAAIALLSL